MSTTAIRFFYVNFYFGPGVKGDAADLSDGHHVLRAELLHKLDALAGTRIGKGTRGKYVRSRYPDLSPRQAQVCALIACGYSAAAIVLELGIGDETVVTVREAQLSKAWHFYPRRAFRQLHYGVLVDRRHQIQKYMTGHISSSSSGL
jgi:hypothetical protein